MNSPPEKQGAGLRPAPVQKTSDFDKPNPGGRTGQRNMNTVFSGSPTNQPERQVVPTNMAPDSTLWRSSRGKSNKAAGCATTPR